MSHVHVANWPYDWLTCSWFTVCSLISIWTVTVACVLNGVLQTRATIKTVIELTKVGEPRNWEIYKTRGSTGQQQSLLTNEIAHNQNLHSPHVLPVNRKGQKQTPLLHRPPFWHSGSPNKRQPKKPKHNRNCIYSTNHYCQPAWLVYITVLCYSSNRVAHKGSSRVCPWQWCTVDPGALTYTASLSICIHQNLVGSHRCRWHCMCHH